MNEQSDHLISDIQRSTGVTDLQEKDPYLGWGHQGKTFEAKIKAKRLDMTHKFEISQYFTSYS